MAIVNSLAVGKATKTAGELTYAKVRGRTIARRRILSNKSNTAAQEAQRFTFGVVSSMAALIDPYIKQNFAPTEYGSARNCFLKRNWPFLKDGYQTDNPAEMSFYSVIFDVINAGGYIQYGQSFEGSLGYEEVGEESHQLTFEAVDKDYKDVTLYVGNLSATQIAIAETSTKPQLVNGVWSWRAYPYDVPSWSKVLILLAFIDGKPVINNTGGYIVTNEGGL